MNGYDPNHLLDAHCERLKRKRDSQLSRSLDVGDPLISKIRQRHADFSATLLIRMQEVCGIEISNLRNLMGDRRPKF
jgi:hypothetical protein